MRMPFSSIWSEFKSFAFKGNMIDLAVAVVIGAAFGGVINSLVKDIIMPSITYVTTAATTATTDAETLAKKASSKVGLATNPTADTQPGDTRPADAPAAVEPAAPAPPPPPAPAASPDKPVDLSWTIGRIRIGAFVAELLNFVIVAFAVFIIIVKLLGSVMKKVGGTPEPSDPTTKECPLCLSVIPLKARRCAHCTADLSPT